MQYFFKCSNQDHMPEKYLWERNKSKCKENISPIDCNC